MQFFKLKMEVKLKLEQFWQEYQEKVLKLEILLEVCQELQNLFEARKPKDFAIISEIDGVVEFGADYKTKRRIRVVPQDERN